MDVWIGGVVLVAALTLLVGFVVWSRRRIDLIAEKNVHTVREIMQELRRER